MFKVPTPTCRYNEAYLHKKDYIYIQSSLEILKFWDIFYRKIKLYLELPVPGYKYLDYLTIGQRLFTVFPDICVLGLFDRFVNMPVFWHIL